MKKHGRSNIFLILCGLAVWFLSDAQQLRSAASRALQLCGGSVIPSLFPFMAVSGMLVAMGFGAWITPLFSGLMAPLFRLPGCAGSAWLLGLVGGYPIGAQTAAGLFADGTLTKQEAQRLLTFCNNSNPVFLISILGVGVFGSVRAGVWLWLIHVSASLLTGLLFRGNSKAPVRHTGARPISSQPPSFPLVFVSCVKTAGSNILSVCAFVIFFYVLASPFSAIGGRLGSVLVGMLELFSLTPLLTPDHFGFILSAGCAGWGGLSVLCQTAAVLDGSGLSMKPCLMGKLVQGLLSALLAAAAASYALI